MADRHGAEPARSSRVLIVEDEARLAALLSRHLTELGLLARVEGNGATGLEVALAEAFDLLILDVVLPGMDAACAASIAAPTITSPSHLNLPN